MTALGEPAVVVAPPVTLAPGRRVLAFCDYYGSVTSGGAERVTHEVLRGLRADGVEAEVVTTHASTPPTPRPAGVHAARSVDLSKVLRVQVQFSPTARRVGAAAIRDFRPDVLYAHSLHFQSALAAARLRARHDIPLVTTVHVGPVDALPRPVRAATRAWESSIGRVILRRSDRVIAVSDAVAEHVARLGVPADRVVVIPNGVDHVRFHAGDRPAGGRLEVLFVGRLIANKAPAVALRALAALRSSHPDARLTIAGDGPERPALDALAHSLGLGAHVRFLGERPDVDELLRAADVFVRPSLTEGMSLAVLEAMACGVCVVASDILANRELLGADENGLLVAPGDHEALARALGSLADDPARRLALARKGHAVALEHSWTRTVRATSAVLEGAIHDHRC